MEMHKFEVGQLYNPNRKSWPPGTIQYNYRGGNHELLVCLANPTSKEIASFKDGTIDFALFAEEDVVMLVFRTRTKKLEPGLDWSDAPYSWWLVPQAEQTIPLSVVGEERALFQIFLVDATTGILKVIKAVSVSHDFTNALHAAIRHQIELPFDPVAYNQHIDQIYQRFPHSRDLAQAAQAVSRGGS